jgi:hypothetical protein
MRSGTGVKNLEQRVKENITWSRWFTGSRSSGQFEEEI